MSHFYGCAQGSRGHASRGGTKKSGYHTIAASWDGAIEVKLEYDAKLDTNFYVVSQSQWHGKGINQLISRGIIGEVRFDDRSYAEYNKGYDDGYKAAQRSILGYWDEAHIKEDMRSRQDAWTYESI